MIDVACPAVLLGMTSGHVGGAGALDAACRLETAEADPSNQGEAELGLETLVPMA